ncbi:MAG: universal stress protein [Polyangiaceae bacterium]|nr:universal stress protein [Polyangiaceae bacterium]
MATRILLATDFSDASEHAIEQAHAIAARDHAVLGLCHVVPEVNGHPSRIPTWLGTQLPDPVTISKAAAEALDGRAKLLATGNLKVHTFLEEGESHAAIVRCAEKFAADLVVVGSHGRTGISRILLGSVAEKVVRTAHCPVLVARQGPSGGPVITATDFSDASLPGVRAAASEAARTGSPLVVLNVFDLAWPGATPYAVDASGLSAVLSDTEALRRTNEELSKVIEECTKGLLVNAKGEVLVGEPASMIVRRAEELGARLVVVSTHGRTGLTRVLLGSVAERIVRLSHTSVLAVHTPKVPQAA